MCVIAIVDNVRPTPEQVKKMWDKNPDGVGVAFFDDENYEYVHWRKGLDLEQAQEAIATLPMPFTVHFRNASPGMPVTQQMNHPFPIEPNPSLKLEGKTKKRLLIHNGNFHGWKERLMNLALSTPQAKIEDGEWSDTRAMAMMTHFAGDGFPQMTKEKIVVMGPDVLEYYGAGWTTVDVPGSEDKLMVSNDAWNIIKYNNQSKLPAKYSPGAMVGTVKYPDLSYPTPPAVWPRPVNFGDNQSDAERDAFIEENRRKRLELDLAINEEDEQEMAMMEVGLNEPTNYVEASTLLDDVHNLRNRGALDRVAFELLRDYARRMVTKFNEVVIN